MTEGICNRCGEFKKLTRGYCSNKCYCYLTRHNLIEKLEKNISPTVLTKLQEEILIGSMLGDGCLYKHQNYAPYLSIVRKLTDYSYLNYEFQYFTEFCNHDKIKINNIFDKRTKKIYKQCKFITRPSEVFESYHKKWYGEVKILPSDLVLTPLVCSIWFCDDGCITINKKTNRLRIKLSTHCFTKKENQTLIKILKIITKETFTISCDDDNYFIYGSDAAAKAFINYTKFFPLERKITWTTEHFNQEKSRCQLKNRDKLDMNEKSKNILKTLSNGKLSPRIIAEKIDWKTPNSKTPSGLQMYLKRFLEYKWVKKSGTPNSYKDSIQYELTDQGFEILNLI
jgi:hypothetical protein